MRDEAEAARVRQVRLGWLWEPTRQGRGRRVKPGVERIIRDGLSKVTRVGKQRVTRLEWGGMNQHGLG